MKSGYLHMPGRKTSPAVSVMEKDTSSTVILEADRCPPAKQASKEVVFVGVVSHRLRLRLM
jgi:hypothetical protein